jgi:NitT/TauT family transport system ATP-binding protein
LASRLHPAIRRAGAINAPLLRAEGIRKSFPNGTVALDGFGLAVRRGEFVSLLGPSGCGKSTALRIVAGLVRPSAGLVTWEGGAPRLGFVFQEATLMPWRTVRGNVRLPLQLAGVGRREAEARTGEALERVGLAGFAGAYPRELSGGMRMRASIARAIATRPGVLLMDEPFAALDEITRNRLNDDLLALWEGSGLTVIFVTHSVYESVYLSSRIVVMAARPGRVAADLPLAPPSGRTEAYRAETAYLEGCRAVSAALKRAMGDA